MRRGRTHILGRLLRPLVIAAAIAGCGLEGPAPMPGSAEQGAPVDVAALARVERTILERIARTEGAAPRVDARAEGLAELDRALRNPDGSMRPGGVEALIAIRDRMLDDPQAIEDARAVEQAAIAQGGRYEPTEDDLALWEERGEPDLAVPYDAEGEVSNPEPSTRPPLEELSLAQTEEVER